VIVVSDDLIQISIPVSHNRPVHAGAARLQSALGRYSIPVQSMSMSYRERS